MNEGEARVLVSAWGDVEIAIWVGDIQTMYVTHDPETDEVSIDNEGNNATPWRTGMVSVRVTTTDGEAFVDLTPEEAHALAGTLRVAAQLASVVVPTIAYAS